MKGNNMQGSHYGWVDASRENFGKPNGWDGDTNPFTIEQVTCGALCRIADGIEKLNRTLAREIYRVADGVDLLVEATHPTHKEKLRKRLLAEELLKKILEQADERDVILHKKMDDIGFPYNPQKRRSVLKKLIDSDLVANYTEWDPQTFDWSTLPLTANQQKLIDEHISKKSD